MTNPRILNLDELELSESDIAITHKGETYKMRTLSVDMFLTQQKRARQHEKAMADAVEGDDTDTGDLVELIRDAVLEFFPALPVGELPTAKLFTIFAWLNELSSKINELSSKINEVASDDVVADASAEGNVPMEELPAS